VPNSPPLQKSERKIEEKYYFGSNSKSPSNSVDSPETQIHHQQQHVPFEENNFDPNATAFWGVPMSFDIDEWNSYFTNQSKADATPAAAIFNNSNNSSSMPSWNQPQ
jgi:hypothetical protein